MPLGHLYFFFVNSIMFFVSKAFLLALTNFLKIRESHISDFSSPCWPKNDYHDQDLDKNKPATITSLSIFWAVCYKHNLHAVTKDKMLCLNSYLTEP